MSPINADLLGRDEIMKVLDDLFLFNQRLIALTIENNKIFNLEYNTDEKVFTISNNAHSSITDIINFSLRVRELKDLYYEDIKSGIITKQTITKFKLVGNKFNLLMGNYVSSLESFRDKLQTLEKIPKENRKIIDKNLFGNLYDVLNTENNILDMVISYLENNLNEEVLTKPKQQINKPKIQLNFPEKVNWEKVTFKIKDGMQDLEIFYNGKYIQTLNYHELGFSSGTKEVKEKREWALLTTLSALFVTDIKQATPINLANMLTKQIGKEITIENIHQIKKSLAGLLKNFCHVDENPFISYSDRGYYETKFKLLPAPSLRTEELWSTASGFNDDIGVDSENDTIDEY